MPRPTATCAARCAKVVPRGPLLPPPVFTLGVPPLRELENDKLLLLEHFRRRSERPFELDEAATERWLRYDFPGNVRELRNMSSPFGEVPGDSGSRLSSSSLELDVDIGTDDGRKDPLVDQALRQLQRGGQFDLDQTLKAWERGYIQAALRRRAAT